MVEEQSITWQELDDLSGRLAATLHKNLKSENPIIVYGHKDPYMLVCFLACVKAGRAYCPIDASVPLNRVEMIIEEVEPELVLSTELLPIEFEKLLLPDLEGSLANVWVSAPSFADVCLSDKKFSTCAVEFFNNKRNFRRTDLEVYSQKL